MFWVRRVKIYFKYCTGYSRSSIEIIKAKKLSADAFGVRASGSRASLFIPGAPNP